ncbi:MAG: Txe/YoeB family addiction module toxin, partial [Tannerella sp.]|nr:Txe/YoeB family addiction module toxin [Tannerella sp.]
MMKAYETKNAKQDKKIILKSYPISARKKLETLVKEILTNPCEGTGKPEPLKYSQKEMWSRRLDDKNRIIYGIEDGCEYGFEDNKIIVFYQYLDHYE